MGSSDAKIHAWDPLAEKPEPRLFAQAHQGYVTSLALTDSGELVSGAYDGKLIWWDIEKGEPIREKEAHAKWIRDVTATADRKTVISVADDMICRVWDAASGELRHELAGHEPRTPNNFPSMLFCATVSPDGKHLATADKVGTTIIWDLESGEQVNKLSAPLMYTWDPRQRIHSIGGIRSLAFSADSKLLAMGGINQIGNIDHLGALARVEVFDWEKGERTLEFKGDSHKGLVERLFFGPDNHWLCAAGGDHGGFVQFIDLAKNKVIKQEKAPMHVHDAFFNDDFTELCAVGHQKIAIWSLQAEAK